MNAPLHIVIDEREQTPWAWPPDAAVTSRRSLVAGDYALKQDCEEVKGRGMLAVRFAIERKSLNDFLGTIAGGWERFQRELVRMESFPARVVIVEGDMEDVCFTETAAGIEVPDHDHPMLTPKFVCRRIAELTMMNVSVLLAGNAGYAAALAYRVFRRRVEMERGR